jgi:AbrB family looped-hinge helix DNA binding protein
MSEKKTFIAKVQSTGRIAIPYEVREYLGIGDGDLLVMEITEVKRRTEKEVL